MFSSPSPGASASLNGKCGLFVSATSAIPIWAPSGSCQKLIKRYVIRFGLPVLTVFGSFWHMLFHWGFSARNWHVPWAEKIMQSTSTSLWVVCICSDAAVTLIKMMYQKYWQCEILIVSRDFVLAHLEQSSSSVAHFDPNVQAVGKKLLKD